MLIRTVAQLGSLFLLFSICKQCRGIASVSIFKCCSINGTDFGAIHSPLTNTIIQNYYLLPESDGKNATNDHNLGLPRLIATNCHQNEIKLSISLSISPNQSKVGFLTNGYLQNGDDQYAPSQYCISRFTDKDVTVKIQPNTYCQENRCLRKCCGPLEVYDLSTYGISKILCVPSHEKPWVPTVYPAPPTYDIGESTDYDLQFKSDHPRNWCSNQIVLWSMRTIRNDRKSLFHILSNGSIVRRNGMGWKVMNNSRVCIEGAINIPGYYDPMNKLYTFSGDEMDTIILECDPDLMKETNAPLTLYGVGLAISMLFLLMTLIVYGLLWDKQNIHGWTLLGYVVTMIQFYGCLLATFIYLYTYTDPDFVDEAEVLTSFCGILSILSHFLYICNICWLTVISFDIFSKFRILKLTGAKSRNKVRFLIYLLFTVTVPSIIVGVGLWLDIRFGDELEVNVILPRYGWNKCFLDLNHAAIPYLFGPIGVLLGLNSVLYFTTIFHMHRLQESTKFASTSSSQTQKHRTKIRLFSKLFLLMGVSWIFEIISFLAFGAEANIVVIIGDMINILQPVLVFIIFVCKRDVLESLCQKYSIISRIFSNFEAEQSTESSASGFHGMSRIWNPVATTRWFRSRINSTVTDTSNISNQSVRSVCGTTDPSALTPLSPVLTPQP